MAGGTSFAASPGSSQQDVGADGRQDDPGHGEQLGFSHAQEDDVVHPVVRDEEAAERVDEPGMKLPTLAWIPGGESIHMR